MSTKTVGLAIAGLVVALGVTLALTHFGPPLWTPIETKERIANEQLAAAAAQIPNATPTRTEVRVPGAESGTTAVLAMKITSTDPIQIRQTVIAGLRAVRTSLDQAMLSEASVWVWVVDGSGRKRTPTDVGIGYSDTGVMELFEVKEALSHLK
ncbi:MAG: hypothetical protein LWW77_12425 [Propionibacteriales bacterium]|nr:hypothetical protein [Propionibacteriales bacterium]